MLRSLGRRLCIFLWAALLIVFSAASSSSWGEPIGRLFSTPDERANLDRARLTGDRTEPGAAPSPQPAALTLNGIVKRSSGKTTVWINGSAQNETDFPPGLKMQVVKSRPPEFPVLVQKTGKTVTLKVGQTLNVDSGEIRESYQPSAIKAPSAAAEISATQTSGAEKVNNG